MLALLLSAAAAAAEHDDEIAVTLINHFEAGFTYGHVEVRGVAITDHAELARFYEERRFEPVWVSVRGERRRAGALRRAITAGAIHGLEPWRYHFVEIDAAASVGAWGDVELLLSQAFLAQVRHRSQGVVDPARVDSSWLMRREPVDGTELLGAVARGANPSRVLNRLWPKSPEYWRLLAAKQRLLDAPDRTDPAPIAAGPTLKPGMDDLRVPALRLRISGIADSSTRYDEQLVEAVIAFQRSAGLEHDGVVGRETRAMLNLTREDRLQQIDVDLERWRWLPASFPPTHILVNIADFRLTAVRHRRLELDMPVIVGTPYRQTPVFTETMKYLVFNPFWDVPRKLAVQDQLKKLQADAARQAALGFEAAPVGGGPMVPVDAIDWSAVNARRFPYHLRQRPGPSNPLGRIKFMLPNEYAIYLHDTPSRALFERTERHFSSGCIRVADAMALAEWVLTGQKQRWDRERIEAAVASGDTRTVVLDDPVPVFVVYFTTEVAPSGDALIKNDVYGRDARIIQALLDGRPRYGETSGVE